MMLGLSAIRLLEGVTILPSAKTCFGENVCAMVKNEEKTRLEIKKWDYEAVFDGVDGTVKWIWRKGDDPNLSVSTVDQYAVTEDVKPEYESELREWINQGRLLENDECPT